MKIVCDACGAKYAIADEKVRGKVFKIRCKKCSNVIVVRGSAGDGEQPSQAEPQQETRTFDYAGYDNQEADAGGAAGGEGVWHLVIDQEQVGPLTEQEIQQRFAAGQVDRETYAWREGFDDWVPLGSIPDFANLGAEAAPSGGEAAGGMFGAGAAGEADQGDADPFAGAAAAQGAEGGGDLFGGAAAAGGDGLFGGNGASDAAADRRLRGERNENSVLFSLNNLAALASDTPKAASNAGAPTAASAPGMAQAGGGEGSGLIDIRSLAQLYTDDKPRGGAGGAQAGSPLGAIEPVAFPAQSSVLLPTAPAASNSNKTLYIVLGVAGALLAAAIVLVVVVLSGGDKTPAVATAPTTGEQLQGVAGLTGNAAAGEDKPDTDPGKAAAGGTDPGKAAADDADPGKAAAGSDDPKKDDDTKVAAAGGRDKDDDADERRSRSDDDSSRRSRDSGRTERKDTKPESSGGSASSGGSRSGSSGSGGGSSKCLDEVGCLLADHPPPCCSKYGGGGGGGGGGGSRGGGGSSNSNLPDSLGRGDITTGINKVRGKVSGCGSKNPGKGQVKVSVKVTPAGTVGSVSVQSAPNPALGSCVANAVKSAKFAKTQKGGSFTYPFVF